MNEYCYSFDEECFIGSFTTLEECIEVAKESAIEEDYETFYIGITEIPKINFSYSDFIVESMSEDLYEECGEFAEDFNPTLSDQTLLDDMLQTTISSWLDKIGGFKCYKVINIKEYKVKND